LLLCMALRSFTNTIPPRVAGWGTCGSFSGRVRPLAEAGGRRTDASGLLAGIVDEPGAFGQLSSEASQRIVQNGTALFLSAGECDQRIGEARGVSDRFAGVAEMSRVGWRETPSIGSVRPRCGKARVEEAGLRPSGRNQSHSFGVEGSRRLPAGPQVSIS
jgi:hypothetical protein